MYQSECHGAVAHIDPSARDLEDQVEAAARRDVAAIRFTDVASQAAIAAVTRVGLRIVE